MVNESAGFSDFSPRLGSPLTACSGCCRNAISSSRKKKPRIIARDNTTAILISMSRRSSKCSRNGFTAPGSSSPLAVRSRNRKMLRIFISGGSTPGGRGANTGSANHYSSIKALRGAFGSAVVGWLRPPRNPARRSSTRRGQFPRPNAGAAQPRSPAREPRSRAAPPASAARQKAGSRPPQ